MDYSELSMVFGSSETKKTNNRKVFIFLRVRYAKTMDKIHLFMVFVPPPSKKKTGKQDLTLFSGPFRKLHVHANFGFLFHQFFGLGDDIFHGQTVLFLQIISLPDLSEGFADADAVLQSRLQFSQCLSYCAADAADDVVVLSCHDCACFSSLQ